MLRVKQPPGAPLVEFARRKAERAARRDETEAPIRRSLPREIRRTGDDVLE